MFPGSIQSPGFERENKTKPELTREIEGDDAMLPEDVVGGMMNGLDRGETFIVCEPIGELLLALGLGFVPVNNILVHAIAMGECKMCRLTLRNIADCVSDHANVFRW